MNKNKRILILRLFLLLTACTSNHNDAFKEYRFINVSTRINDKCKYTSDKQQAKVSFSNEWDDSIVVVVNNSEVFNSKIVTEKSTAVTGKGFTINGNKNSVDTINVFIVNEKKQFSFKVNYLYSYIKLYKVEDSIMVYETNCVTLIY